MKNPWILVIAALLALGAIYALKSRQKSVTLKPSLNYGALIKTHSDQAGRRNLNAFESFKLEIDRILETHEPKLKKAVTAASKEGADYESCSVIIYYLAWDKVRRTSETEAYLSRELDPILKPAIDSLSEEVNDAIDQLRNELQRSTLKLAKDLAALAPQETKATVEVDIDDLDPTDLDTALRNLGFNAAGVGVAITFDAFAISSSRIGKVVWKKLQALAAKLFAKQAAKVAGSAAVAAADGPLPIGDILAIGGLIWTGYDVIVSRSKFERELRTSLSNMLQEAKATVHKQAVDHAKKLLRANQTGQDKIGTEALETLSSSLTQK